MGEAYSIYLVSYIYKKYESAYGVSSTVVITGDFVFNKQTKDLFSWSTPVGETDGKHVNKLKTTLLCNNTVKERPRLMK